MRLEEDAYFCLFVADTIGGGEGVHGRGGVIQAVQIHPLALR